MLELVKAGGWLMLPIILCSLISLGIFTERLWTLRRSKVVPRGLTGEVWQLIRDNALDREQLASLRRRAALGQILAAGLTHLHMSRAVVKESIEDAGRHVVHELERYLNALATIAAITPLLGLLGTVIGMIKVFFTITEVGVGDPAVLAGGISEALITTASGLSVAIPTLIFYRFLRGRINDLVMDMEAEAIRLVDALYATRGNES